MTRYYFHIREAQTFIPDDDGLEFPTFADAHSEAILTARDLAEADFRAGRGVAEGSIDISDRSGKLLEAVPRRIVLH